MTGKIILASQSPRRKQLLEWAEINFDVKVSDAEESFPPGLSYDDIAIHIAQKKAQAVAAGINENIPVLAADTIVVCDGEVIGKPKDSEDAFGILKKLSGNKHLVITGVVIRNKEKETAFADTTEVFFHALTDEQIRFYIDHYKPYDKAGAYAIQEWIGVVGIKGIRGDFYNVMGLPVSRVVQALSDFH